MSNYQQEPIDLQDGDWLGSYSPALAIRRSGLWNIKHIDAE